VQCYFQIQSYRYKHIKLEIDVPEDLMNYTIPKIVLQPVVENSILHGILCRDDKTGIVSVSGSLEANCLTIKVIDNGIGMTNEKIEGLLSGKIESKTGGGFGVKNTQERLRLHYGSGYGLAFSSEISIGTTAVIRILPQY
jgi:two-component system, sensor histidine kinase YesM